LRTKELSEVTNRRIVSGYSTGALSNTLPDWEISGVAQACQNLLQNLLLHWQIHKVIRSV